MSDKSSSPPPNKKALTDMCEQNVSPQLPLQLPMEAVGTEETTLTCLMAMRKPKAKLGLLDHRHTITTAVKEEMDSEKGGKEEEAKVEKMLLEMEYETNPHQNLRSSV